MNLSDCRHCGNADAEFYPSYPSKCKVCVRAASARWQKKNPKKASQYTRLNKYGLSQGQYDELIVAQDGKCAICGASDPGGRGSWHIDHDHGCCPGDGKTCGQCVRGLLCVSCNWGLGHFKDDPMVLLEAADYLIQRGCGSN